MFTSCKSSEPQSLAVVLALGRCSVRWSARRSAAANVRRGRSSKGDSRTDTRAATTHMLGLLAPGIERIAAPATARSIRCSLTARSSSSRSTCWSSRAPSSTSRAYTISAISALGAAAGGGCRRGAARAVPADMKISHVPAGPHRRQRNVTLPLQTLRAATSC
jgi:hypothetical protein